MVLANLHIYTIILGKISLIIVVLLHMIYDEQFVEGLVGFLRQFVPLTDSDIDNYLIPIIELKEYSKREIITYGGQVENYLYFIVKGSIRQYYIEKEEVTTMIAKEGHLITNHVSFFARTPSEYFIETIEPSAAVLLSHANFEALMAKSQKFEKLGRLVVVYTMALIDKRTMSLVRQTPRERFLNYVNHNSEILQRVPQKYIASYLNIKPETFSRFKHLVKFKKHTTN